MQLDAAQPGAAAARVAQGNVRVVSEVRCELSLLHGCEYGLTARCAFGVPVQEDAGLRECRAMADKAAAEVLQALAESVHNNTGSHGGKDASDDDDDDDNDGDGAHNDGGTGRKRVGSTGHYLNAFTRSCSLPLDSVPWPVFRQWALRNPDVMCLVNQFNIVPSRSEERDIIAAIMREHKVRAGAARPPHTQHTMGCRQTQFCACVQPMRGGTMFVLSHRWWTAWCKYSGYTLKTKAVNQVCDGWVPGVCVWPPPCSRQWFGCVHSPRDRTGAPRSATVTSRPPRCHHSCLQ